MNWRNKPPVRVQTQSYKQLAFYAFFGTTFAFIMLYYFSNTVIHYTTDQQFPINSLTRYPLSIPILLAEIFSFAFASYFLYNLFTDQYRPPTPKPLSIKPPVAILIPVYNEPKDIVERTLQAANEVKWPEKTIYLLDDSTDEQAKTNMRALAKKHNAKHVTRPDNKGYKAGNINHAVKDAIKEEFFVILDSDQAPHPELLSRTMNHFSNQEVFFVQTPQYYINDDTPLRRAAKVGTNIFYQAQCVSKARDKAMPFCGTNVIVRTQHFKELKGFSYYTSTEDIDLGLRANDRGWHGVYVPEVLVRGYAPPNWRAYETQQYRWANGNLAILTKNYKELAWGKFSLLHQTHTLFTIGWWFIGLVTLAYIFVPLISLATNLPTHHLWLSNALIGLLYVNALIGIMLLFVALRGRTQDDKVTLFDAFLQYSLIVNSMFIYTKAAINALLRRYTGFVTTNKNESQESYKDIKYNLLLAATCFVASGYALYLTTIAVTEEQLRTYLPISLWLLFYAVILTSSILFIHKTPAEATA